MHVIASIRPERTPGNAFRDDRTDSARRTGACIGMVRGPAKSIRFSVSKTAVQSTIPVPATTTSRRTDPCPFFSTRFSSTSFSETMLR